MKRIILFLLITLLLTFPVLACSAPDFAIVYAAPHVENNHISNSITSLFTFFVPLLKIIINSAIGWLVVILLAALLFYFCYLLFRFVSYLCKSFSMRSKKAQKYPLKSHQKSKPKREPELYYVCINDPYYHRKDCPLLRNGECIVAVKFRTVFLDKTPPCPYCKPRDNYVDPSVYSK